MRPLIIAASALIVPFAVIHFLEMFTGDPVAAVGLALILFITVAAWFAGSPTSRGGLRRSRG